MQWIKEYWFILGGVISSVATFLIGQYKSNKTVKKGLCALQRNSILKSCEDYMKRGYASIEEKNTLSWLYKSYHELGGNNFITEMVEQVNNLPLRKEN